MESQTKSCLNCKNSFVIESDDFGYYEKIHVPPPTLCPDCRLQRRLSWRNEWHLFKRKDSLTGKDIFSIYPNESPITVYDKEYWNTDAWDPLAYGKDFDFSRPFFDQFKELMLAVPFPSHSTFDLVDCQYCTNANNIKGCYLVCGASLTEDCAYVIWDKGSKKCLDSHMTDTCELSYGNVNTVSCYRTFFSVDCDESQELIFCKDCVGCTSCVGSIALRNKSYYIFNQPYGKEEYLKKLEELNLGSEKSFQVVKQQAYANWLKYPQKFMHGRQNANVSGDYIYESKNAIQCYRVRGVENSKFVQNILTAPVKDSYDYTNYGDNTELVYESMVVGSGGSNIKFCSQLYPNTRNLTYCLYCNNSSNLFGCISLRNKQYCIFNKQYTKEEYEVLVPKIIEYMKTTNEYGEFFPASLSPLPYQATAAHEFFPLEEAAAKEKGFASYSVVKQSYTTTLSSVDIPDQVKDADESILKQVIECTHKGGCKHECTGAFRIIQTEFDFCKRMNIPLPRLCPNCRHYERLALRNLPKYYHRSCQCKAGHLHGDMPCKIEFETSYAPDRPEIIYCEQCYQQEVF